MFLSLLDLGSNLCIFEIEWQTHRLEEAVAALTWTGGKDGSWRRGLSVTVKPIGQVRVHN